MRSSGQTAPRVQERESTHLSGQCECIPLQRLGLIQVPALQRHAVDGVRCASWAGSLQSRKKGVQRESIPEKTLQSGTQRLAGFSQPGAHQAGTHLTCCSAASAIRGRATTARTARWRYRGVHSPATTAELAMLPPSASSPPAHS